MSKVERGGGSDLPPPPPSKPRVTIFFYKASRVKVTVQFEQYFRLMAHISVIS